MAERRFRAAVPATDKTLSGEDWYGQELSGQAHTRVGFEDLDLTEAENRGSVFTECVFQRAKFNCSVHRDAAFVNCTFRDCDFFETQFIECKLVGSKFEGCSFDLMHVQGGNWSHVALAGADLRRAELERARMREADLTGARCEGASLRALDLAGALLVGAKLAKCDLRGSDLSSVDPGTMDLRGAIITIDQALVIAHALGLDVRAE
jgi:fluoroquinolone resistance protein